MNFYRITFYRSQRPHQIALVAAIVICLSMIASAGAHATTRQLLLGAAQKN